MFEKISELVEHKDEELGKVKASLRSERVIRAELETKLRKQELELRMVAAERERWSERVTSKSSPTSGKRWDEMAGGTGGGKPWGQRKGRECWQGCGRRERGRQEEDAYRDEEGEAEEQLEEKGAAEAEQSEGHGHGGGRTGKEAFVDAAMAVGEQGGEPDCVRGIFERKGVVCVCVREREKRGTSDIQCTSIKR